MVMLVNSKNKRDTTLMFSLTGNQGKQWKMATAVLGHVKAGYEVCTSLQHA